MKVRLAVLAIGQDISGSPHGRTTVASRARHWRVLAEAPDLAEAVPQLLCAICESLECDRGEWWEFNPDSRRLACRDRWYLAAAGADEFDKISQPVSFAPGEGLPGRVWSTGQPAWLDELQGDAFSIRRKAIDAAGFRSAFAFAAMFHNQPLGVLLCFSRQPQASEPELLASMASLGSQIGQFLARKRAEHRAIEDERLTAVGQAMEGLIHEGRNALQRSQACLEMLAMEIEGHAEATRLIARVQQAQNELHLFYERVREYALPLGLNRGMHHLGRVLTDAWESLSESRRGREAALNQQERDICLVNWVDREKLAEVFRILLENSLAAADGSRCHRRALGRGISPGTCDPATNAQGQRTRHTGSCAEQTFSAI